ncbi:methionyl-tRNA formyltransferase [Longibacter salinarum]|uniref:Methionyl-tRNA formyltransferase n=1 Tax=Longibacter salinarum TaxID=1850348 RepID=A0A2A8CXX2_9BACT|nr:methionyl-tRNA formyltransferase [Longibacter salinarum]PEN13427.1 methionyl-tRNA formyltransferase [Longibacter salinarum]
MRILFMGTPEFAVPSLEHLCDAGYTPIAVATGPDRGRGRGQKVSPTPVKKVAKSRGIETILQPESVKDDAFAEAVSELEPDVIAVVAYRILPPQVYTLASKGAFNLHGSLLPKYRGAAPINWAIMNGEEETGVTTFFLQEKVDTGDVILKRRMPIGENETAGELHDRMMIIGAEAVVETVRQIEDGAVETSKQDDGEATPAPKIFTDDCETPWDRPAGDVHNHIRGLSPYPGAWTRHEGTRLKLYRSRVADKDLVPGNKAAAPGTVLRADEHLVVACGEGAVDVVELQQPGKRRLGVVDFLNGYDLDPGDVIGA